MRWNLDYTKLQKVTIKSNSVGYGPLPEDNEEVEQRLTISRSGRVWLNFYTYSGTRLRNKQIWLGESQACHLLAMIGTFFGACEEITLATDIGMWEMKLWDTDGATSKFVGSLCCHFQIDGSDLSTKIRETLNMADLFLFDGGLDEEGNEK